MRRQLLAASASALAALAVVPAEASAMQDAEGIVHSGLDAERIRPSVSVDESGTAVVDLYGWRSGFAKARVGVLGERHSITVGPLPSGDAELLDEALEAWNEAAGWQLFVSDSESDTPDVQFVELASETCPNYGACTGWEQFPTGWYRQCTVMLWPWDPTLSILTHELGHCLGFEDVTTAADNDYRGMMSYARNPQTTPNNPQDVASLEAAGYRTNT